MLAVVTESFPEPYLWRLLIDRWHQGRGIGTRVISMLRGSSDTRVTIG